MTNRSEGPWLNIENLFYPKHECQCLWFFRPSVLLSPLDTFPLQFSSTLVLVTDVEKQCVVSAWSSLQLNKKTYIMRCTIRYKRAFA